MAKKTNAAHCADLCYFASGRCSMGGAWAFPCIHPWLLMQIQSINACRYGLVPRCSTCLRLAWYGEEVYFSLFPVCMCAATHIHREKASKFSCYAGSFLHKNYPDYSADALVVWHKAAHSVLEHGESRTETFLGRYGAVLLSPVDAAQQLCWLRLLHLTHEVCCDTACVESWSYFFWSFLVSLEKFFRGVHRFAASIS